MITQKSFNLDTKKNFEIIDITSKVNDLIDVNQGIVSIFSRHSTSAIVVNENERGLLNDLEFMLDNLVSDKFSYQHDRIDDSAEHAGLYADIRIFLTLLSHGITGK